MIPLLLLNARRALPRRLTWKTTKVKEKKQPVVTFQVEEDMDRITYHYRSDGKIQFTLVYRLHEYSMNLYSNRHVSEGKLFIVYNVIKHSFMPRERDTRIFALHQRAANFLFMNREGLSRRELH